MSRVPRPGYALRGLITVFTSKGIADVFTLYGVRIPRDRVGCMSSVCTNIVARELTCTTFGGKV